MKFWIKLILSIITIITIILSCSRFIIIRQNFMHSIQNSANQNMYANSLQRYYLESKIVNDIRTRRRSNK